MSLTAVDSKTYNAVVSAVPEHSNKINELRRGRGIYYSRQYVFDEQGRLVAFHDDDDGTAKMWADVSLLTALKD